MSTLTLLVPGMTCRHCVRKVTAALRDVPGVQLVQADLTTTTVVLRGDPTVAEVLAALDGAGFPGTVRSPADPIGDASRPITCLARAYPVRASVRSASSARSYGRPRPPAVLPHRVGLREQRPRLVQRVRRVRVRASGEARQPFQAGRDQMRLPGRVADVADPLDTVRGPRPAARRASSQRASPASASPTGTGVPSSSNPASAAP